jgi:hypothetical protein
MRAGWLTDYARGRWGLYALSLGAGILVFWLLGTPGRSRPPGPTAPTAPTALPPKDVTSTSSLSADGVRQRCRELGVDPAISAAPNPAAVTHPGFPRPAPPPTVLGPAAQGVFAIRTRLNAIPVKRLPQAPLLHQAARGFATRYVFYQHLVSDRAAATRYLQQQERLAAAATDPLRKPKVVTSIVEIAQRALQSRQLAQQYFKELTTGDAFRGYPELPDVLLDFARFLLAYAQRPEKTEAMALLHRVSDEYPTSAAAIEAKSFLAAGEFAKDRCAKVMYLTKSLPTEPFAGPVAGSERAVLRALAHYYAGTCELKASNTDAGLQRLGAAMRDGGQAAAADKALGETIAREAALQYAKAYAVSGDVAHAQKRFSPYGEPLRRLMASLLVSQLLKEGNLRDAAQVCTPPGPASPPRTPK